MISGSSPKLNKPSASAKPSSNTVSHPSLFKTIPPERVGLNGEYDHNGLAKRVVLAFSQEFEPGDIANVRVIQRGRVVVLVGTVATQRLLTRLAMAALRISGAADVETYGINVEQGKMYSNEIDCLVQHSYAC